MNLEEVTPLIVNAIKKALAQKRYPFGMNNKKDNKIASGTLYNSVTANVVHKQYGDVIEISMAEYAQFVQSGRLPGKKGIPISVIEKWIGQRKLKGRNKTTGRFITNKSFAFAIQKSIIRFGIKPSNFIDVALDDIMNSNQIMNLIEDATIEDLINAIEGI
jgi:hypothetical protein